MINKCLKWVMSLSHCSKMNLKHTERHRDDEITGKDCQKKEENSMQKKREAFLFVFKSIEKETRGRDTHKSTHTLSHLYPCLRRREAITLLPIVRHKHTHCSCKPPTLFVTQLKYRVSYSSINHLCESEKRVDT